MKKVLTTLCLAGLACCLVGCDNMTKQDVGVLTGGAIGGLLGSQFGKGGGQVAAAVGGAVVGGLIGGQIGKSMDQADQMRMQGVLERTPTDRTTSWRNPGSHAQYAVTPTKTYYVKRRPCREYRMKAWIGGKQKTVYGKACRQPGGDWKIVR